MGRPLGLVLIMVAAVSLASSAQAEEQQFSAPGQTPFTVPPGVTGLHVETRGAGGGPGSGSPPVSGGSGRIANGNLAVTAGSTLYVTIGGVGLSASGVNPGPGGSNGGASGGTGHTGTFEDGTAGGGGGGATDLRTLPLADADSLLSRLIVAGGGGGGGGSSVQASYGIGGLGANAGNVGQGGGGCSAGGQGGNPGSTSSGGSGGIAPSGGGSGFNGNFGLGGPGGPGASNGVLGSNGGGGGGGGYYGGGGGGGSDESCHGGGGGGGGATYFAPQVMQPHASSFASGNGFAQLSWLPGNGGGDVVISQVYGGAASHTTPAYTQNFIELFNRSDHVVSLNGWAVQYADPTSPTWAQHNLPNVTLQPGDYFLVQANPNNPNGIAALPTPDTVSTLSMAEIVGRVALTSNTTALTGYCPTRTAAVVDFVGWGSTVTCFEGAATAGDSSAIAAPVRKGAGCIDTDDNASDFPSTPYPDPRNTSSPLGNCFIPVNVTEPTMTGTPSPGNALTCHPGTWTGNPTTLDYRFVRSTGGGDFFAIDGSASDTYTVQPADVGARVACEEIATNASGTGDPARSNSKLAAGGVPVNVAAPTLNGKAILGQTIECANGMWDNAPTSFTRQWTANGQPIAGETGDKHAVGASERGKRLACEVTASNDVGTGAPASSASLFAVAAPPENRAAPTLVLADIGPRPTDKEARCDPGSWFDDPGLYSYTIERAGAEIVATDRTYKITVGDLGRSLTCTVTASNDAGSRSRTSAPITVPLPPPDASAGPARMFKAGGTTNEFEPVNLLATSDGLQKDLDAAQQARVQAAYDQFRTACGQRTLDPGLPTRDPRTIVDKDTRERELCRLILNTPAEQIQVGPDGVRIVADPSKCVMGTSDPCAVLPIPMPPANTTLNPPGIDSGVVPERVLWDFNSDGRLDADCPGTAPVARTIFRPGYYNVRAILVLPGSEESGQFPSTTLTLKHWPDEPPPGSLLVTYKPGGVSTLNLAGIAGRRAGASSVVTPFSTNLPTTSSVLQLGKTRAAQPFACRTSLDVPVATPKPCVAEGYIGKVHVQGNLCPISLRSIPGDEVKALKKSDPDVYELLVAQNEALDLEAASARNGPPAAAAQFGADERSAFSLSMAQFASPLPTPARLSKPVTAALTNLKLDLKQAPVALDQIYISRGSMKVNGVELDPAGGSAVVMIPSDVGDLVKSVKQMTVSASNAVSKIGGISLDPSAGPFKQAVEDASSSAEQLFKHADLDQLKGSLASKLNLGPFRLAGDADVKLADGVAILTAKAELPSLLAAPGEDPIRTTVTIRAQADGSIKLDGIRLNVPQAYLGAVKLKGLDLAYDGGLTIRGQLLFPPNDAGIDVQEFRLDDRGRFRALTLAYLAGAGTGIPVGPGVFLTKVGGGFSLDPDEIRALAAVSVGPSAGGGCPVVGADGSMNVHFGPAPFFVSTNVDLEIVCLALANVDFYVRGDGYASLAAKMGFDAGPLYFSASMKGQILLPNWQIEGEGSGGIRKVLSATVRAIVSNRGLAACGEVDLLIDTLAAGAGVRFNPTVLLGPAGIFANVRLFTGCDLSSWRTVAARASQAGVRTVRVAKGERALVLGVEGLGAAPRVRLKGPDGSIVDLVDSDAVRTKGVVALRAEDEDRSVFMVGKPAAGLWTVEPAADSVRIVRMQRSAVLAKPKVTARVRRAGVARVLTWSVKRVRGQVVRFVEEGVRGGQLIATVRGGGRGSKRFIPTEAAQRGRTIVAQVEQDALPRDNIVVARFSAPSPRVGKAGRVSVKRRGGRAVVTWRPAFLATRYDVIVERSDGGRTTLSPPRGRRTIAVKVGKREALRVRVLGISATGKRGRAATGRLAAPKPKARRKARR